MHKSSKLIYDTVNKCDTSNNQFIHIVVTNYSDNFPPRNFCGLLIKAMAWMVLWHDFVQQTFEDIIALFEFFFFFLNFNSSYTCIDVKLSILVLLSQKKSTTVLVNMRLQHGCVWVYTSISIYEYTMHLQHVLCFIHNFMGWVKFSVKHYSGYLSVFLC